MTAVEMTAAHRASRAHVATLNTRQSILKRASRLSFFCLKENHGHHTHRIPYPYCYNIRQLDIPLYDLYSKQNKRFDSPEI